MYYISMQDSTDTDKWCYMDKYHTWDQAAESLKSYMSVYSQPCRVEWSAQPPLYTKVPSVY